MGQLTTSTREEVLEKEGRHCPFCGMSEHEHEQEYGRSLDIHHIVPSSAGGSNDPENLVPVCMSCHKTLESIQATGTKRLEQHIYNESDLQQRIDELEEELEEAEKMRDKFDRQIDTLLNNIDDLLVDPPCDVLYVVHESNMTTSTLLYAGVDEDDAMSAFSNADNHVTMETVNIRPTPLFERLSESDIEQYTSKLFRDAIEEQIYVHKE